MEPILNRPKFSAEQCRDLLGKLIEAQEFEQFLHVKYIGRKRFSIEGGEALIPMLHALIETGAALNVRRNGDGDGASRQAQCAHAYYAKALSGDIQ